MITFGLLVWFTMNFVWPPLMQALEERKKKIADGLAAGEKGKHELELADKKAKSFLKEAKAAKQEGERIKAAAEADIERAIQQAKEELRKQVAVLAISAAGQILRREVDINKHKEIINSLGNQLGQV